MDLKRCFAYWAFFVGILSTSVVWAIPESTLSIILGAVTGGLAGLGIGIFASIIGR